MNSFQHADYVKIKKFARKIYTRVTVYVPYFSVRQLALLQFLLLRRHSPGRDRLHFAWLSFDSLLEEYSDTTLVSPITLQTVLAKQRAKQARERENCLSRGDATRGGKQNSPLRETQIFEPLTEEVDATG